MSKHQSKFRLSALDEEHLRLTSLFKFKTDISCSISCSYISSLYLEFDLEGSQALRGLQQVKGHCHKFYQQFLHKYYMHELASSNTSDRFFQVNLRQNGYRRQETFIPSTLCDLQRENDHFLLISSRTLFQSSVAKNEIQIACILKWSFNKGSPRLIKIL